MFSMKVLVVSILKVSMKVKINFRKQKAKQSGLDGQADIPNKRNARTHLKKNGYWVRNKRYEIVWQ